MKKTESLALTQYNFLTDLVIDVLSKRLSEPLSTTDRSSIFKTFVMPGVQWAISKHHPELTVMDVSDRAKIFVADLRISSEEPEHMEIFLSLVDFVSMFVGLLLKLPNKITYEAATKLTGVPAFIIGMREPIKNIRNDIAASPIGYFVMLAKYGEKRDIDNFEFLVKKQETTGKWDWKFFDEHNLMVAIMKALEKSRTKNEAAARQKHIKEAKDKLYRENKPTNAIDKIVWNIKNAKYNTTKTFKESEVVSGLRNKIKKAFGSN
ncbi:MAG: hypothetical protein ACI4NZ_03470 [Candidatus Enterousia sp.]